jgi:hypothetical protein
MLSRVAFAQGNSSAASSDTAAAQTASDVCARICTVHHAVASHLRERACMLPFGEACGGSGIVL